MLLVFPLVLLLVRDWDGNRALANFLCVYVLSPPVGLSHLRGEPSNTFHHSHPPWHLRNAQSRVQVALQEAKESVPGILVERVGKLRSFPKSGSFPSISDSPRDKNRFQPPWPLSKVQGNSLPHTALCFLTGLLPLQEKPLKMKRGLPSETQAYRRKGPDEAQHRSLHPLGSLDSSRCHGPQAPKDEPRDPRCGS